ncbi:prepilin peptidase [Thermoanaerobacterium thermosaccharolyticum]|uniref:prepilin peptidase n=1 Tax=Thermoanaerobacterium thermosaccharolyticum TaxID=1517 RepID=UPI001CC1D4AF|nr:prepilin peptidase [Thermoanaerobacterium thermosaccharolyticum]
MLAYLSYVDLKKREVPDFAIIVFFIYSLFFISNLKESLLMAGLVFLLLIVPTFMVEGCIGGGDIKLLTVMSFFMGNDFSMLALPMFVLLIFSLIYGILKGKGLRYSVPLVPYVFLSYIFYLILEALIRLPSYML